jgi:hypothetical protein
MCRCMQAGTACRRLTFLVPWRVRQEALIKIVGRGRLLPDLWDADNANGI